MEVEILNAKSKYSKIKYLLFIIEHVASYGYTMTMRKLYILIAYINSTLIIKCIQIK